MAKMGEGTHYYFLPKEVQGWRDEDMYHICRRDAPHPNFTVICEYVTLENASLIVDALNFAHAMKRQTWESADKDNMEYQLPSRITCFVKDMMDGATKSIK